MEQKPFLISLCAKYPDAVIIGSIGTISYDLTDVPHPNKILLRGAMGAVLGCALGHALAKPGKVIAVIGDGAFLMKMGSMATILAHKPPNLEIHVINNNSYKSCGGQKTNYASIRDLVPFNTLQA